MLDESSCDCLSPLADENSRWRFEYRTSVLDGTTGLTTFTFGLSVRVAAATCHPVSYRAGNCCNSTLNALSLSMAPEYQSALQSVRVLTDSGYPVNVSYSLTSYGVQIVLPGMLFVDSIPAAKFYTFSYVLKTSVWPSTDLFPCNPPGAAVTQPVCDYFTHGWQTAVGDTHSVLDGPALPGCCPEGIVSFRPDQAASAKLTCSASLRGGPYRLQYSNTLEGTNATKLYLDVAQVTLPAGSGTGCNAMDINGLLLFLAPSAAEVVNGVTLNGAKVAFSILPGSVESYVSVDAAVVPGASVVVSFAGAVDTAAVCPRTPGGAGVCGYVLQGAVASSRAECCIHSDFLIPT